MNAAPRSGSLLKSSFNVYRAGWPRREGLHSRRGLTTWHHCCPGGRILTRSEASEKHKPACSTSSRAARCARSTSAPDRYAGNHAFHHQWSTRALGASDQVSSRRRWASSCCSCLTAKARRHVRARQIERTLNGRQQPSLSPRHTRPISSHRRCRMRGGSAIRLHVIQARS
jgi:hypothetical protein